MKLLADVLSPVLAQVLVALVLLLIPPALLAIRTRYRIGLAAKLLQYVTAIAAQCVAAAAEEVRALKDPARPGTWNDEARHHITAKVMARVFIIAGVQVRALVKLMGRGLTPEAFVSQLLEAQVEALRRAPSPVNGALLVGMTAPLSHEPPAAPQVPQGERPTLNPSATPLASLALLLVSLLGATTQACATEPPVPSAYGLDAQVRDASPEAQVDAADVLTLPDVRVPAVVRVWLSPAWAPTDAQVIRTELDLLRALGPEFVEEDEEALADVRLAPFTSESCTLDAVHLRDGLAVIDPACAPWALQASAGHMIGHALGMAHVCADCDALMGPHFRGVGWQIEVHTGAPAIAAPTMLDVLEYRRALTSR